MSRSPLVRLLVPRQLKFLATGVLAVVVDYCTFFVAYSVLSLDIGAATVASFLAGLVVSFGLNKLWVFQRRGDSVSGSLRQLSLYGTLLGFNIAFTYALIAGLQHYLGIDPRISKLASIVLITVWNYPLYGRIIFVGRATRAAT